MWAQIEGRSLVCGLVKKPYQWLCGAGAQVLQSGGAGANTASSYARLQHFSINATQSLTGLLDEVTQCIK